MNAPQTPPRLFDSAVRRSSGPTKYSQSDYSLSNEREGIDADNIRSYLEQLFTDYCTLASSEDAVHLANRFRDHDNAAHRGALTELKVFDILRKTSSNIELEPNLPHTSKKPDFEVTLNNGDKTIHEITATVNAGDQSAVEKYINEVKDVIDGIRNKSCFVNPTFLTATTDKPDIRDIKKTVENAIAGMSADQERIEVPWNQDGWSIAFFITHASLPKQRNIGSSLDNLREIRNDIPIRNAIKKKRSRYGNLMVPYVIWVNMAVPDTSFLDDGDIYHAIYGALGVRMHPLPGPRKLREKDGVFVDGKTGSKRLSAVAIFRNLSVGCYHTAELRLMLNPNADYPLPTAFRPATTYMLADNGYDVIMEDLNQSI